ncbi:Acetyltransferase (GNAT) family protein [Phyllobacterium sp. CL33Tsu]|uniref:GNAT family N-acetyltransferase n=1 Tax=Phyllobacterium sp. CL33Tsu TaxID=1798191 RepID=UPI0008E2BCA0|nr:GNAT family N-acetyltransferase [Phyllobacterium sp. CL33Tsu]SFI49090.1 Acetyltransferase (GNAT) family protein [Phyllobacterium sp. CL33Tsu]
MANEDDLKADPAIVGIWAKGWALTRQVAAPVFEHGAYRIEVGLPDQKRRHLFPAYSDHVLEHAEAIREPFVFLKVCAPAQTVGLNLPRRWHIGPPGYMMLLSGEMFGQDASLPDGYSFSREELGAGVTLLNILDGGGEIAATGRIAFPGELAVYDRIRTHENHRRRGLGRALMKQLERLSHENGIRHAALVATPDGRALYQTLGWQLHSPYTTVLIPPEA